MCVSKEDEKEEDVGGAMVLAGCVVVRWCLSSFPSASGQASPGTLASAGDPCWESAISGGLICLRREGRLAGETIGRQSNNNVSRYVARHDFCCVCLTATRRRRSEAQDQRISISIRIRLLFSSTAGTRHPHQCGLGDYVMLCVE
jgi:hypothetical protein